MEVTRALVLSSLVAALAAAAAGSPAAPAGDPPPLGLPAPWHPDDNGPTEARVALGRRLFSDPILSRDRTVSCSTCHPPEKAYADGKALAVGVRGQVQRRNAPTLLNAAYARHLFWDGRESSLESQAVVPVLNPTEMDLTGEEAETRLAADADYPALFAAAYGEGPPDLEKARKALAVFQRTLVAGDAPFDRWWNGDAAAMGEEAVRGFRLFMGRGRCSTCHPVRQSYALFTDDDFHNTGAGGGAGFKDPGRMAVTGLEADRGKFKTPTLRNVALTAPYMHDGSQATLLDVVDFYDRGGVPGPLLDEDVRPLLLSRRDRLDLVAFLEALTSPVIPQTGDGRALLERGEFRGARERFLRDLAADPEDDDALFGLAEASLGTGDAEHLLDAGERLAAARERDIGREPRATASLWRGRVFAALAGLADADGDFSRAEAHRLEAALAFARAREFAPWLDDGYLEGAAAEEACGRGETAEWILTRLVEKNLEKDPDAFQARGELRYRRGLQAAREAGNVADGVAKKFFSAAIMDLVTSRTLSPKERWAAAGGPTMLTLARCFHWHGELEPAESSYVEAVRLLADPRPALTGLASLLSGKPKEWTGILEALRAERAENAQVLWFLAFDRYSRGDLDGAEESYLRLAGLLPRDSMTRVFLGRIVRDRSRREGGARRLLDGAWAHWETALRLDPGNGQAVADWDETLRSLPLDGWESVKALDSGMRRLLLVCGDPAMRILVRNNVAFRIREAVSSFTSRGRGRMQYLVKGADPEALAWMKRCTEVYEEAVAEMPPEEEQAALPFRTRWVQAGVLNDAGLMRHYFAEVQDLDLAERLYLRSFRITEGAYMDAYFYNLQFLYGFERPGREERWLKLASVAREAILREDPEGEDGFSPDERKRAAAERDWERLRDLLGEERADAAERADLPR